MMVSTVILVALVLASVIGGSSPARSQIPLTKCCSNDNELYLLGVDSCKAEADVEMHWPPQVYSAANDKKLTVNLTDFNLTYGLPPCSDGYISQVWTDFRLYDNGMVWSVQNGMRYQAGRFCIAQMKITRPESNKGLVIRHCVEDPCRGGNCISKCCPHGMSMESETKKCQPNNIPFQFKLQDEKGMAKPNSSLAIRYGVTPNCPDNLMPYFMESNDEGQIIFILPNGTVVISPNPLTPDDMHSTYITNKYCIDNLFSLQSSENNSQLFMLACSPPVPEPHWTLKIVPYILFTSSIFLIATFVVYALLPEIRNIHGISIMCSVASMAIMYIGLGIIQVDSVLPENACIGLAIVTHYAFLSTFTWLNVMSFDIWWTFSDLRPISRHGRRHTGNGQRIIFYSLYAWTFPLFFVLTGIILDNTNVSEDIIKPGFGLSVCWFDVSSPKAFVIYLYGPMAVLIFSNVIFFVLTVIRLYRATKENAMASNHKSKEKLRVIFSLFILMGVSWMTEFISYLTGGNQAAWFILDLANILTGVFIFFMFVCKPNVWKLLKFKFPRLKALDPYCPSCMTGPTADGSRKETHRFNKDHESNSISLKSQSTVLQDQQAEDCSVTRDSPDA